MKIQKPICTTSFVFQFEFDSEKNTKILRESRECSPEQIGIYNKDEVEQAIIKTLGVEPIFNRHHFEIGRNGDYNVYVSEMCRQTLKDLFGKEDRINALKAKYNLTTALSIVPHIAANGKTPNQCLSLDNDIIEFLYKTRTQMDLDYYVI